MVCINFHQIILLAWQQSKSPCVIALDNGGSKAPIRLSRRGRSCLAQLLNLGCLGQAQCRRRIFSPFQPILSFDNKTCTWKRGHARHRYVRKKPHHGGVDICNYTKTCISFYCFSLLFICLFNNIFTFLYLQCLIYIS